MSKQVREGTVLEGIISARVYIDGSLTIEVRRNGRGTQWSWEDIVELSPEGTKVLRDLLVRDEQLRIGAEAGGGLTLNNALGLLKECLENGDDGSKNLYAWFCSERGLIEKTVEDE